ncbi:MAG: peptidoglycan bridge formation glycyltransferase FemA/FemB family protein [Patescibacteria group bacterium]|nr:peptidoglycan bridge formation glycyltransferase FemA/FemB family protein [Patescibacteria group bacterium]
MMNIIDLKKEDFLKIQTDFLNNNNSQKNFWSLSFLQSLQWSEIQENYGQHVFLRGLESDNKIIGFFVAIEKKIWQSKKYWYIPRGPIFFDDNKDFWLDFFLILKKQSLDKNLKFIRLEPINPSFLDYYQRNKSNLIKTIDVQPSKTSFLNLNLSEDDLMKNLGQKTRYNIKLAQKKGIEVSELGLDGFKEFWKLMSITAGRDNFFIHSKEYYNNLISSDNDFIKLFSACFKGKVLAMGIFSFFGSTVSYLHGASSNEMRNLMAPYLLQWELIKIAKNRGFKYYDFYGVDEKKWPGVSRFKNGFSGEKFSFPGTFDYIIDNNFYKLYKFFRHTRKKIKSSINIIKKIF